MARQSDPSEGYSAGFSMEEMKAIAVDVGLDPGLVERAARLTPVLSSESRLERAIGGPVKHRLEALLETELTEARTSRLLTAIRAAAEQHGQGESNAAGVSWKSVGEPSQIYVTAYSEGEGTRVKVSADRGGGLLLTAFLNITGGLTTASIIGAVLSPESVVVGASIGGLGLAGGLALGRAVWATTTRSIRDKTNILMDTISRSLADVGGQPEASALESDLAPEEDNV